jgi:hypothetical protein
MSSQRWWYGPEIVSLRDQKEKTNFKIKTAKTIGTYDEGKNKTHDLTKL